MKYWGKRALSALTIASLLIAMFAIPVFADENTEISTLSLVSEESAGNDAVNAQTIYSLANHYYVLKASNGKYLLGNNAGYEAQAKTIDKAIKFYFKASDLGEYILYDQNSKYLNYNSFNAVIRNTSLTDKTRWKVDQYEDGSFSFYNYVKKKYVGIKGTSLVWRDKNDDPTIRFFLEEVEGNNPFPEADTCVTVLDEEGNPVSLMDSMKQFDIDDDVIGYVDTHAHLNHNLASGQVVFNGETFNPLGIAKALDDCTAEHGVNGAYDVWGKAVDGAMTHNTYGYPDFGYWPTAYSTTHMQTYYKWIERSFLAGQRILVHQCVNNEVLANVTNALPPYANADADDMHAVDRQIANVYKLQDYIDAQCGGPGCGWFRICLSAADARQVISEGKMAVFIGIEVDTLFGATDDCIGDYNEGKITEEEMNAELSRIRSDLDKYYDKGVRSIFMIHALNNGFGGTQLYQGEIFSIMNYLKTSDFYQPEVSSNPRVRYKQPKADLPEDALGHGNVEGLSETGKWFTRQLIDKKMMIEIDHLSDNSFNDVLDICWEEKYPGLIASHTRILDMFEEEDEAWEQLDIPRMIKVYQLGGFVSVMLWETIDEHQICAADYLQKMIDLSASSTEPTSDFLYNEKYEYYGGPYEVPTTWYNMNDNPKDDLICGVGYGSDVNGACMLPYFDKYAEYYAQVDYDNFDSLYEGLYNGAFTVKFDKQKTGNRTFDLNGDRGVAHYGLIPDMIEKLSTNLTRYNKDATFNSAEAYLRTLERVANYSDTYPSRDESQWLTVSTEYWHE